MLWKYALRLLLSSLLFGGLAAADAPRVWVFAGNPGDDEHHRVYEDLIGTLTQGLHERYGIPRENLTVLYGPRSAGYTDVCSREAMLAEIARIRAGMEAGDKSPVWIVMLGHANKVRGGSMFNLPGPDLSMKEMGREIARLPPDAPLVLWCTTTASESLLRDAAGPNHAVVAATSPKNPENETEFPNAFVAALLDDATDTDSDGTVTVPELFSATRAKVLEIYQSGGFVVKEQALLDGDGDGKGSSRPSKADISGGERFSLTISRPDPGFD